MLKSCHFYVLSVYLRDNRVTKYHCFDSSICYYIINMEVDICVNVACYGLDLTTIRRPKGCFEDRVGCTALLQGELRDYHRPHRPDTPGDCPHRSECVGQGSWCNLTPEASALLTTGSVDPSTERSSTLSWGHTCPGLQHS